MNENAKKRATEQMAPIVLGRGPHKNVLWVFVLGTFIAGAMYAGLFYLIQSNVSQIDTVLTNLAAEAKKEQKSEALRNAIEKTKDLRARLDDSFVFSDDIVPTIEKIESLGAHAGVVLIFEAVNVKQGVAPTLEMQVRAGGDFESLFYLLSLIEALPFKISLERVSLDKKQKNVVRPDDVPGAWTGTFALSIKSFLNEERKEKRI